MVRNCKSKPSCGHCGDEHEAKDCVKKNESPRCKNCKRQQGPLGELTYSATDAKKCPILERKIKEKIANINYGHTNK